VLAEEIALHRETESLRLDLAQMPSYKATEAYKEILLYSGITDKIDRKGLELFLCAKGYTPDQGTLNGMIRRIDQSADKAISEKELTLALTPMISESQAKALSPEEDLNTPEQEKAPTEHRRPSSPLRQTTKESKERISQKLTYTESSVERNETKSEYNPQSLDHVL